MSCSYGQSYFLNGSAQFASGNCYNLTPNVAWQNGTVWYAQQLNLTQPFTLEFYMNFGSTDVNGADGMVFVLQTVGTSAIGQDGGGMGFQGFNPSFGIEFDTFTNTDIADIAADHVAFLRNGVVAHNGPNNLAGPVQAHPTNQNIEDGQNHIVKITWDPTIQNVSLYFDCSLRLSSTINLINTIFNGNSMVYWGFTGATGFYYNQQSVCLGEYLIGGPSEFAICLGSSAQLIGAGNPQGSFLWSPSTGLSSTTSQNPIATPQQSTVYTCVYTDLCNQQTTYTYQVQVEETPVISAGQDVSFCQGATAQLVGTTASTGLNIGWSGPIGSIVSGANSLNPVINQPGVYTLTATTPLAQCSSSDQVSVSQIPLPQPALPSLSTLCPNEQMVLDVGNNWDSVIWNTGEQSSTITISGAGTYEATVSLNSCVNSVSAQVQSVTLPEINLGPDQVICQGSSIVLSTPVVGEWSTGIVSDQLVVNQQGVYEFNYTLQGCSTGDALSIAVQPPPVLELGADRSICLGDTVWVEIPYTGLWSDGEIGSNRFFTTAGIYGVLVTEGVCSVSDQFLLSILPDPLVELGETSTYCTGNDITLSALNQANDSYFWNTGDVSPHIEVSESGIYAVTVQNQCGLASDSIAIVFEECNFYIYIPNTFTPNADGVNDVWFVQAYNISSAEVFVYDRWGTQIYSTQDLAVPWIGDVYGGNHFAQDGVYHYLIRIITETGDAKVISGHLLLMR